MAWSFSADPLTFEEALAALRAKAPMLDIDWDAIDAAAREQAFTVAGVAQLDIIADVWRALDEAIASGATLEDFKDVIGSELEAAWGGTVSNPGWRIETIFRTNAQVAFSAGRVQQMTDPDVLADHPYWLFDAVMDSRTSEVCRDCDRTVRPADDPWWRSHTPPLHHNCRSGITSLSKDQAEKFGIAPHGPNTRAAQGFGAIPKLAAWGPKQTDYPHELWSDFKARPEPEPIPQPPPGLREGVHVDKITVARGIDAKEAQQAIDHPVVLKALAKAPLKAIEFKTKAKSDGDVVNGFYNIVSKSIQVTSNRASDTYGHSFVPGQIWSVSTAGKNTKDAVARTLTHEIGHHVHLEGGNEIDEEIQQAFNDPRVRPITGYAASARLEYFAETFAAYQFHQDELKDHDPVGFDMVEKVLRLWDKR